MKKLLLCLAATAGLAVGNAQAATVTVSHSLDLNGYSGFVQQLLSSPATVSPGDTLDFTVNFLPGQALLMSGPGGFFWSPIYDTANENPQNVLTSNITLEFLGAQASPGVSTTLTRAADDNSSVHIGSGFSSILAGGEFLQFTGYRFTANVTAMPGGATAYESMFLNTGSADVVEVDVASVPEPTAMAMMGLGTLGMMGYGRWRKRGQATTDTVV